MDLGRLPKRRYCLAKCKLCFKSFKVCISELPRQKSCGCIKYVPFKLKNHKRLLRIFNSMRSRCYNPNNKDYKNYGGRKITINDEWLNNPYEFCYWALKNAYKNDLTIDRIDNDKGYFPENCRWVSVQIQSHQHLLHLLPS